MKTNVKDIKGDVKGLLQRQNELERQDMARMGKTFVDRANEQ